MTRYESKHVAHIVSNIFKNFIKITVVSECCDPFLSFPHFKHFGMVNVKFKFLKLHLAFTSSDRKFLQPCAQPTPSLMCSS